MKRRCLLDRLVALALRFVLLALAHLLSGPRSVEPSPQDLKALLLLRCPSGDRNFIGRSTMVRVRINSLHVSHKQRETDDAKN